MLRKKNTTLRKENKELQDAHNTLMAKQEECKLSLQHANQEYQERTAECASLRAELDEALALLGRTKEILPAITNLDTIDDDPVITNPVTNENDHPLSSSVTSEEADMPS
jgi:chromosome segregation ATPase